MSAKLPVITLYGRRGCHHCADARGLLDRLARQLGFAIDEVDVDADAALLVRYDVIVPVVAFGDEELARAPIEPVLLQQRIATALGHR